MNTQTLYLSIVNTEFKTKERTAAYTASENCWGTSAAETL